MLTYESEMLPILSANKHKLGSFKYEARELPSGYGIADVVFYNLDNRVARKRIKTGPISSTDILRLLTELSGYDEIINVTMFKQRIASVSTRTEAITYLVNNGYIQELEDGSFKRVKDYKIGFSDVVAIEAKLKDWRRGLYQAYRYKDYANKSYLALYSPYVHRALKEIDEFRKYNVGLIEVSDEGLEILFEPSRSEIKPNLFAATAYESTIANV
ncbi:MAG: hypothetical protein JWO41_356 [Candidatus Saccharibacteria bacterium]|nr:hypothetical protein [Candidatus Saccharibacteria bacterium]